MIKRKRKEEESEEFGEIPTVDTDTYQYGMEVPFNHETLVMRQYYRVLECLSKEMREGFWTEKTDNLGNVIPIYQPDTRQEGISSIETLKNLMCNDLKGTIFKEEIINLMKKAEEKYDQLVEQKIKQKKDKIELLSGEPYRMKRFIEQNPDFNYDSDGLYDQSQEWHFYISFKLGIYRKILEQLELCLADRGYLKKQKGADTTKSEN